MTSAEGGEAAGQVGAFGLVVAPIDGPGELRLRVLDLAGAGEQLAAHRR